MFLLLRNIRTQVVDVVNVAAIQTARADSDHGTTIVWNNDAQRETTYAIAFEVFVEALGAERFCS